MGGGVGKTTGHIEATREQMEERHIPLVAVMTIRLLLTPRYLSCPILFESHVYKIAKKKVSVVLRNAICQRS